MKWCRMVMLFAAAVLLCGCSRTEKELENDMPPEDKRLVIYTSHMEGIYTPIVREFEQRTGIWVEVITGGTNELLERIAQEHTAPKADLIFGGGVESLEVYQEYFESYQCSQWGNIAERYRPNTDRWTPFSALPVVLIYNTKLVEPNMLTCWEDLARPEFRGRIACADPSKSGSSFTALTTHLYIRGQKAAERLAQMLQGRQLSASGEVLNAVEDGSCLVGLTLEETAMQRISAGANIAMVYPSDGTSCVPDGSAIVRDCPHPDNARAFLEFTLSQDVQELLVSGLYRRSVRVDIPEGQNLTPLEELNLMDYDAGHAAEYKNMLLQIWGNWVARED